MLLKKLFTNFRTFFQDRRKALPAGLLVAILLLGAFLRFYRLGAGGVGNTYYAAAVKSMLMSWHNFFFVAFEPGGSISLDKPPLGFWVQALSARLLGLNGFALALPNALAGILSIFVVYKLVRRPFGSWAGLAAALALAVMPVAISAERNNTIDGLLVFVLLVAAWAFLQAVYSGKVRWLFLGAFLVGLGFNIKMLQAIMPLPAFYAVYFFGMKQKWGKKLLHLSLATVLLLIVSFSWAVAVDLVLAADRPYVDSTNNNTVMELIFGHNGIERLINLRQRFGFDDGRDGFFGAGASGARQVQPPAGGFPGAGSPAGSMDFGTAGILRLFTEPLVGEASWLLPFVLAGLVPVTLALWKIPFGEQHISAILWVGWLIPSALYFTYSQGLMHAYYLIMIGAPVAALVALAGWALWKLFQRHAWLGLALTALLSAGALTFEAFTIQGTMAASNWLILAAVCLFVFSLGFLIYSVKSQRFLPAAVSLLLAALLVAPAAWSFATTFNSSGNETLPAAGPSDRGLADRAPGRPVAGNFGGSFPGQFGGGPAPFDDRFQREGAPAGTSSAQSLTDYLLANTKPGTYLLATDRASEAASYILSTGRPVLAIGGFLSQYQEVSLEKFTTLIESGQLRFVLGQSLGQFQDISQYVQKNCKVVDTSGLSAVGSFGNGFGFGRQGGSLYDCLK